MGKLEKIYAAMKRNPHGIEYSDLVWICVTFFGEPRQSGTSHAVFRTPWPGDPRVNIQEGRHGKAKAYQVRQVLVALERLEGDRHG